MASGEDILGLDRGECFKKLLLEKFQLVEILYGGDLIDPTMTVEKQIEERYPIIQERSGYIMNIFVKGSEDICELYQELSAILNKVEVWMTIGKESSQLKFTFRGDSDTAKFLTEFGFDLTLSDDISNPSHEVDITK